MSKIERYTDIPVKFEPFFSLGKYRYKIARGGRGGAKSWQFARILLYLATQTNLQILCTREFQNSIADSVHSLLSNQIAGIAGMSEFYEVLETEIKGRNGSRFFFSGLGRKIGSLKSTEGVDICWVEEGQMVSQKSLDILSPTIRKDNSEIWISYNPEMDDDPVHLMTIDPPANRLVVEVNYWDNPFLPDVLKGEMEEMREKNYDKYLNIWAGQTVQALEGAVYAKEIRDMLSEGRKRFVPYDAEKPVYTAWDIGLSDATAVWCFQRKLDQVSIINYYEESHTKLADDVKWLQDQGYALGQAILPHDAYHETKSNEGNTVARRLTKLGMIPVPAPSTTIALGIEAARVLFPQCVFDEKCADGIRALSRYQYVYDEEKKVNSKVPLHNFASHGSDAFRYLALAISKIGSGVKAPKIAYRRRVLA